VIKCSGAKMENRINILNKEEIQNYYDVPKFSNENREEFFSLNDKEETELNKLRKKNAKAFFLLQLGYFKSKRKIFTIDLKKCYRDLRYINKVYLNGKSLPVKLPSTGNITSCNNKVLSLTGYKPFNKQNKNILKEFVQFTVRKTLNPRTIFSDIVDFLDDEKIELPGYSYLQKLIGSNIEIEHKRMGKIVKKKLMPANVKLFDNLTKDDDIYKVRLIKRNAKDFKIKEIHQETERHKLMKPLFPFCMACIKEFSLAPENVIYLASLLDYYSMYKLGRMKNDYSSVILISYLYFRYIKSNDVLIESMQHWIRKYRKSSTEYAKNKVFKQISGIKSNKNKVAELLKMYNDKEISGNSKFKTIRKKAHKKMNPEEIEYYANYLLNELTDVGELKWEYFKSKATRIKQNIRPIFLALEFYCKNTNDPIINAIDRLKTAIKNKKSLSKEKNLPQSFIPKHLRKYIIRNGQIDEDCYEIVIYYQIINKFEAATLYIRNSKEYRALTEDLASDSMWENRKNIINNLPYPKFKMSIKNHLEFLEDILEEKLSSLSQDVSQGINKAINVVNKKGQQKWSLSKYTPQEEINNPFFDGLKQRNISDVIYYVHKKTGFLNYFSHIAPRYSKGDFNEKSAIACLVAMGSNLGLSKMSDISNIDLRQLTNTYQNYFRLETLGKACAVINNDTSKLFAFDLYKIDDKVHASVDGQKFGVESNIYKARYSPKYLGSRKGVVCDSIIANHLPIAARIIGANQHESHFLYDLIFNNLTTIDPKTISTDMHGVNNVNFALLYMFDREFSPRYTSINSRINSFYCFKNLSHYKNRIIKPFKRINKSLIISEWDNLLRIFLSLAMKETNQSTVVRKLSSNKFNSRTKLALWEFDNIIRTIDTLNYLNNEYKRKGVNKALCRGEAYHQLKRAVVNVGGERLKGTTENEIMIWDECARILTSCIIYYNMELLSKIMGHEKIKDSNVYEYFKSISPVAWRHINFLGKYEINDVDFEFDISSIVNGIDLEFFKAMA
jgi:TnpA family transposase